MCRNNRFKSSKRGPDLNWNSAQREAKILSTLHALKPRASHSNLSQALSCYSKLLPLKRNIPDSHSSFLLPEKQFQI